METTDQCRCCLSPLASTDRISITSTDSSSGEPLIFSKLITACTGITFSKREFEICFICVDCRENLLKFYAWKSMVLDANKTLRSMEKEEAEENMIKKKPKLVVEKLIVDPEEFPIEESFIVEDMEVDMVDIQEVTKTLTAKEVKEKKAVAEKLYKREADGLYHCQKCTTTFKQIKRLLRHLETEHVYLDQDKFVCQLCGEVFPMFKYLKSHHLTVHREKPYTCEACGKTFSEYNHVRAHIKRVHLGIKHYQKRTPAACIICGKVLNDKKQLALHHQSFHLSEEKRNKPFECQICGAKIKLLSSFKLHKKKHLEPQQKYPCPDCGRELSDKYRLQDHIKRIHENRKDYHCDICGSFFKSAVGLRLHSATAHSDARPFQCELCPDTFKTGQILQSHMKRVHNDLPSVQCDICEKWVKNVITLKEHKKQHEGKLFECDKCALTYSSKKALFTHNYSAHFAFVCLKCDYRSGKKIKVTRHIESKHSIEITKENVDDVMKKIAL